MICLHVFPSTDRHGQRQYGAQGQFFDGAVDGRVIVTRAATPFVDAARVLLNEGVPPDTEYVMRHAGHGDEDALHSTIGVAAGLAVYDDGQGTPRLKLYRPYNGPKGEAVRARSGLSDPAPSLAPPDPPDPPTAEPLPGSRPARKHTRGPLQPPGGAT
jgi:hypothetical protein